MNEQLELNESPPTCLNLPRPVEHELQPTDEQGSVIECDFGPCQFCGELGTWIYWGVPALLLQPAHEECLRKYAPE